MEERGIRTPEHVVATEFDGGEGVLVDLNTKHYFQLNETGMFIWRRLEKRLAPEVIAGQMVESFDVAPARASESVERFIEKLRSLKLL